MLFSHCPQCGTSPLCACAQPNLFACKHCMRVFEIKDPVREAARHVLTDAELKLFEVAAAKEDCGCNKPRKAKGGAA